MNKLLLTASFALSLGTAVAQMPQVAATAPDLREITRTETLEYRGLYWMSDGRRMKLWRHGNRIVASLDGVPNTELRPAGNRWLRSSDGRFDVRFTSEPGSALTQLTLTLTPGTKDEIPVLSAARAP